MSIEEASFVLFPMENSDAFKSQANLCISNASGLRFGLSGLFGGALGDGHFLTFQADGAKILVKLGVNDTGSIDGFATGTGASIAFPVPDGAMVSGVPVGGRIVGTGVATTVRFDWLHARVVSGGVATGYLRILRSSKLPNQDVGAAFRMP